MYCSSTRTRSFHVSPPSYLPRLLLSQTSSCINTLTISSQIFFLFTRPMKTEQTERSETSVHKNQRRRNHPKERIQQSPHGESVKSRINYVWSRLFNRFMLHAHISIRKTVENIVANLPQLATLFCFQS